jgi:hypothetical protein
VPHSISLRAIGQSLEMLRVDAFELEKEGNSYVVRSKALPPTSQSIFRKSLVERIWDYPDLEQKSAESGAGTLRYDPTDISWLDAQGQKQWRSRSSAQMLGGSELSELMRILGEQFDRMRVSAFNISWAPDSVTVNYQIPGRHPERKDFSIEQLRELGLEMKRAAKRRT